MKGSFKVTISRTIKTSAGVGVLAVLGIGGAFASSAIATASTSDEPPAVIAAPSLTEPVYVQRGAVTVGHIRPEDLSRPRPVDSAGVVQDPGYPNIGYSVYDENEVLVGYDTPHFGFVYLNEVENYKADPLAFVQQRALEVGIPIPEGF